ELDRVFEGVRATLVALSELPATRSKDAAACTSYLEALGKQYNSITSFRVIDRSGHVFCSSRPLTPGSTDYGDWARFQEARRTGAFTVAPFMVGRISKKHILAVALPLLSPDGEFDGVVAASIDLGWLNQYFADKSLPTDGAMGVIDRNGIILVRLPALPDAIG